jgi:hypothetical protein
VDVVAGEDLGDDTPLRGDPPLALPQPFEQVADGRLLFDAPFFERF